MSPETAKSANGSIEVTKHEDEEAGPDTEDGQPQRKKQKRNKPTLSCEECVERKTKVSGDEFDIRAYMMELWSTDSLTATTVRSRTPIVFSLCETPD